MKTIILPDMSGRKRRISLDAIEYLRSDTSYVHVHLAGGAYLYVACTLKRMENRLPGFIRIHKCFLVNPAHIRSVAVSESAVRLSGDRLLSVSRRRFAELRPQLITLCKPSLSPRR